MALINFFIQDWIDFADKHNGSVQQTKTGLSPVGFGMSVWKKGKQVFNYTFDTERLIIINT